MADTLALFVTAAGIAFAAGVLAWRSIDRARIRPHPKGRQP